MLHSKLTAVLAASALSLSVSAQIHVDARAVGAGSGASWTDAYTTIDAALAAAIAGAQLWIAEGTYRPGATLTVGSSVTLYGGFAGTETALGQRDPEAHVTTVSGDGQADDAYAVFSDNLDTVITLAGNGAALDGLVVTAGRSPTSGGGVLGSGDGVSVRSCRIVDNRAVIAGGGCAFTGAAPLVVDCTFADNRASDGGGLFAAASAQVLVVQSSSFVDNRANQSGFGSGRGGGMHAANGVALDIGGCVFLSNRAIHGGFDATLGGAIAHDGGTLTLRSSIFHANEASLGGGIYTAGAIDGANAIFTQNRADDPPGTHGGDGGAVHAASGAIVACTFTANWAAKQAGGARFTSNATVANCVMHGNTVAPTAPGEDLVPLVDQQVDGAALRYSCIEGLFETVPGEDPPNPASYPGCIDADPRFVDASTVALVPRGLASRNLRLRAGSPAIDAGDGAAMPAGVTTDIHGNPRTLVDMGAFEFGPWANDVPIVSWTASVNVRTASFTDTSTSPNGLARLWLWDTDGGYALGRQPTHRFSSNGNQNCRLLVWDSSLAFGVSANQTVAAFDTAPPICVLTSPTDGAAVAGTVLIQVDVSDDDRVSYVDVFRGTHLGRIAQPPFDVYGWDTTTSPDGFYDLRVSARDDAGNSRWSSTINVHVVNNVPTLTCEPLDIERRIPLGDTMRIRFGVSGQFPFTYTLLGAPAGMSIDGSGVATWQPTPTDLGIHTAALEVTSPSGILTHPFTVEVLPKLYEVELIDHPNASDTFINGLNDLGHYVGSANGFAGGFLFDGTGYTIIPTSYHCYDVNNHGTVAFNSRSFSQTTAHTWHNGVITRIPAFTSAYENSPYGINDSGHVAGWYRQSPGGTVHLDAYAVPGGNINPPVIITPGNAQSRAFGISHNDLVVGDFYETSPNRQPRQGFIRDLTTGSYTYFLVPQASSTTPYGINTLGQVAGTFGGCSTGGFHSFIARSGITVDADYVELRIPGAISVIIRDINERGQVSGTWEDANNDYHGFVATPVELYRHTDLGFGGPGTGTLSLTGVLSTGNIATMEFHGGLPFASAALFLGGMFTPTPVFGGTLVSVPPAGTVALQLDASGSIVLPGLAGGGGPATLYGQMVWIDPALPFGIGFSNAIEIDLLP